LLVLFKEVSESDGVILATVDFTYLENQKDGSTTGMQQVTRSYTIIKENGEWFLESIDFGE
jgi:hypothetical protein